MERKQAKTTQTVANSAISYPELCHSLPMVLYGTKYRLRSCHPPPIAQKQPPVGQGLLIIEASRSNTLHSLGILFMNDHPESKELYMTTRDTHDRHPCRCGIRTRNPSKRAAADPRLRPCSHQERAAHVRSVLYSHTNSGTDDVISYDVDGNCTGHIHNAHNHISLSHVRLFAGTQHCSTKQ